MKKKFLIIPITLSMLGLAALASANPLVNKSEAASVSEFTSISLPTELDLSDSTSSEIISYYSPLNGKSVSELQGENLLKNLKGIITNNIQYVSYSNVSSTVLITDRDWKNSPVSTLGGTVSGNKVTGYSYSTDKNNNPYLHLLYCDYDTMPKIHYSGDGDVSSSSVTFDKEHVWSQSHGFDGGTSSTQNLTGAGSDIHHLMAGAQYGNRTLHSNYSYGFVKANDGDWSSKTYETKNKRGEPLFSHSEDQQTKVFEPQDSDKGDIARALLYMVAAYNNFDGSTPTAANPALKLVNYVISENTTGLSSDNIENGYYGTLQDILAWHHMDPVDEYEIHRNNLIYKNYQLNRNPFIDYPEWVDYIWGVSEYNSSNKTISYNPTPTGSVNLVNDVINGYRPAGGKEVTSMSITTPQTKTQYHIGESFDTTGMVITGQFSDGTSGDITSYCFFSVDTSSTGQKTVTITCGELSITTTITVLPDPVVSSVTLNQTAVSLDLNDSTTYTLVATINGTNSPTQKAYWSSSNTNIASVNSNGVVTFRKAGSVTITAAAYDDTSKTASCVFTLTDTRPTGSSETITIAKGDYAENGDATGGSGSILKTINSENDLTINYEGAKTKATNPYNYTMYVKNNAFIYSNNSVDGYYPSRISVKFTGGTSEKGKIITTFTSAKNDSRDTSGSVSPTKSGEYTVTNTDDSLLYWNFSTTGENVQVLTIDVTYTTIGGTGEDIAVTGVSLNRGSLALEVGDTARLTAIVTPNDATNQNINWFTDNEDVAYVNDSGVITANGVGTTNISVITEDGEFTAACEVTVTAASTAVSQTLDITIDDFLTHTNFGTPDSWSKKYVSGAGDVGNIGTAIQLNSTTSAKFYNTTRLRGYITNITITANSGNEGTSIGVFTSQDATDFSTYTTDDSNTYTLSNTEATSVDFSINDHLTYFCIKGTANKTRLENVTITYNIAEYLAATWAQSYKDAIGGVCDSTYGNTNITELTTVWNNLKDSYNSYDASVLALIQDSSTVYNTEYKADIDDAISSYQYIAGKYSSLSRYIDGVIINPSSYQLTSEIISTNYLTMMVMMVTACSLSFLVLMVVKKKRTR